MLASRLTEKLDGAQRVLIAGCGGGYDVVCGLPIYDALTDRGLEVHLAGISFSNPKDTQNVQRLPAGAVGAGRKSTGGNYFVEGWLARWFYERRGIDITVWAFHPDGERPYFAAFDELVRELGVDTVIVVDGGVDSLLRGDEHSLGTPLWDGLTVAVVDRVDCARKVLCSTAFGSERHDRIAHAEVLARISELTAEGALLGVESLAASPDTAASFRDCINYLTERQDQVRPSVVAGSLVAALEGRFGDTVLSAYTEQTPLWISPLTALYWFVDLPVVARNKRYLGELRGTETIAEAADALQRYEARTPKAPWQNIPI